MITRENAFALLKKYNQDPFHIQHALTVEAVMKWYADELGYGDEAEHWGIVGLLLYLMPLLLVLLRLVRRRTALLTSPETGLILIGLIGFLIATYFNPWMNAVLGIAWYALTSASVWILQDRKED